MTERWKGSDRPKLSATLSGIDGRKYSRPVFLNDSWKVATIGEGSDMSGELKTRHWELATRHDWMGRKRETLYIETTSTKKQP